LKIRKIGATGLTLGNKARNTEVTKEGKIPHTGNGWSNSGFNDHQTGRAGGHSELEGRQTQL
jgi:hypothetical protein